MIVRLQQFDIAQAEELGGWPDFGHTGRLGYEWPSETGAFEIVIANSDESGRSINPRFRRDHLRSVIPTLAHALKQPDEKMVARLDGPCAPGELFAALGHLPPPEMLGRFAISPVAKLDPAPSVVMASVRIEMDFERLEMLCSDPGLNLEDSVRLRLFLASEELVNPLLEVDEADDPRWAEILPSASVIIQPVGGMDSIQIITPRYGAGDFAPRITRALAGQLE
jgi:hypothetical protein